MLATNPELISIQHIRMTYGSDDINQVGALAGLTKKEMSNLLGVSIRRLRINSSVRLSVLQAEHLLRLMVLFRRALLLFDEDSSSLANWLRTPKLALALPETGFPVIEPGDYKKPSLTELFTPHTEIENQLAYERDMAFRQQQVNAQVSPPPTPLSILDTALGVKLVNNIFGRFEAGVYI